MVDAIARQNVITPVGTEKVGDFEYVVSLNDAPSRISELNDLPIRTVNDVPVYIHDVAYVHEGSPPQINMVRVNGSNAVLMTILKSGSASTLDVIAESRRCCRNCARPCHPGLHLEAVGDQSRFVNCRRVVGYFRRRRRRRFDRLMILIFLGSWRSTLIIMISIPLAILTSVALLAATGETINVMTLGGLALAVGILVDDATVTIENINYHLEQGKDIETAIMDGARQIVIPATVSLLCICIVFVPMFTLGGVAGFLFRPMAKAVVFALIGSYVLSRTLVNTMARFLLAHQATHGHGSHLQSTRNPFTLFQRGFERRFEAVRAFYQRLLVTALAATAALCRWLHDRGRVLVRRSRLTSGAISFRQSKVRRSSCTCARPTGRGSSRPASKSTKLKRPSGQSFLLPRCAPIVDNIGLSISGINMAYSNTGSIGASDADVLIT